MLQCYTHLVIFANSLRMNLHETYMQRCLALARKGVGAVSPNPMVGAVLVYNNRIIGEGWHRQYGGPHAEVNCIASVSEADQVFIAASTLYVSLEPCAHHGKTPPCADLIIEKKISRMVIGCRDPFPLVNGKGIDKLQSAGVEVIVPVLEQAARSLNRRFFTCHEKGRPYVILKWAQTADGFIGSGTPERWLISSEATQRMVHRWRSEEDAILVGTNTALLDNPQLNNRFWTGKQPVRMVLDRKLRLPAHPHVFDDAQPTIILNDSVVRQSANTQWIPIGSEGSIASRILQTAQEQKLQSILVEGGRQLLQSFIDAGCWDEVRIITNTELKTGSGIPAPQLPDCPVSFMQTFGTDRLTVQFASPEFSSSTLP
jgi:diaminohydroxyphosphoribosylaminopyrimidine deaminase/5-amino-6-(5-phosphoribosylamino)uracil reductase